MTEIFEVAIIGGGPAGVSAGVYAARKQLRTIFITDEFGGQSQVSGAIFNWIGTKEISGMKLKDDLRDHLLSYKSDTFIIKEGARVANVTKDGGVFSISLENGESIQAKAIIISLGSRRRRLEVPGADVLEHKGLTYCASCDGPIFSGQDVIVVGGGNAGFETAAQLLNYTKSVTLINRSDVFKADELTVKAVLANPKMRALTNTDPVEVYGDDFVKGMKVKDLKTGEIIDIPAGGIFVEVGQIPNTECVKSLIELDQYGRIVIDPWRNKTSVDGIWAAGDCTNILYHQNNIASGDGVRALEDCYLWIKTR